VASAAAPPSQPARAGAPAVASPALRPTPSTGDGSTGNSELQVGDGRSLSPAVRRIMREQNVSLAELAAIRGSGVAGRVTRDDVLEYLKRRGAAAAPALAVAGAIAPAPAAPVAVPSYPRAASSAASGGGAR